jgi:ankyrin repeat protein
MWCAQNGHVDVCRLLLEARAEVDARNSRCGTPSPQMSFVQVHSLVSFCISQSSPLILSAIQGHLDICRLLIEARANIDAKDSECVTHLPIVHRVIIDDELFDAPAKRLP